jgi:hypothetical protein
LLAACIGGAGGSGTILKMIMEVSVLLALFFFADGGSPRMRGIEVGLPGGF